MDLSTRYLGLTLATPFMTGASPLAGDLDTARRLEDSGASAVVLHSLFEEQVTLETRGTIRHRDPHEAEFAAALAQFPAPQEYALTLDGYLAHIGRLKTALNVPVIASLNGTDSEIWLQVAKDVEQAGADALEVNIYDVVSDPAESAMSLETGLRDMVIELKRTLRLPIALKLSPYYTAFGNLARRLDQARIDGLVLFNRFYQADIDLANLTAAPRLELSSPAELRLRLQWTALLHKRVKASLAVTGGVRTPDDGIKAVLAGADAVQVVSSVLQRGPHCFAELRAGLTQFMEERGFASVSAMKGHVSFADMEDPAAFQRASYIRTLQSWARQRRSTIATERDKQ